MDPDVIEVQPPPAPIVSRSHTKQPKNKQVLVKKVVVFVQFRAFLFFLFIYSDHEFILIFLPINSFFLGI